MKAFLCLQKNLGKKLHICRTILSHIWRYFLEKTFKFPEAFCTFSCSTPFPPFQCQHFGADPSKPAGVKLERSLMCRFSQLTINYQSQPGKAGKQCKRVESRCIRRIDLKMKKSEVRNEQSLSWLSKLFERLFESQGKINKGLKRRFSVRSRKTRSCSESNLTSTRSDKQPRLDLNLKTYLKWLFWSALIWKLGQALMTTASVTWSLTRTLWPRKTRNFLEKEAQ